MSSHIPRPDIILARHGHSEGNAGHRTENVTDIALTERGRHQAEVLAFQLIKRFGAESIGSILTTPHSRTLETARPLIAYTGVEPTVLPGMREITYLQPRKADGTTYEERQELRNAFWAATRLDATYTDEGEELLDSAQSFLDRVHDSLDTLATTHTEDPRLHVLYSHEFPISAAVNIATGKTDAEIISTMAHTQKPMPRIDNTQAVGLTYTGERWILAHPSHSDLFQDSRQKEAGQ